MEYLKDLNEEQLHAVTTKNHKILVLAGAGSGKTKVLTTRIKYLIDNGVNPNEIVAFTFTKKASDEMEDRLKYYHFNNVYTFHSFCYRYIMDWPEYFGFQRPPSVVDDYYKTDVINKILKGMNINRNPSQFLKYISNRKNGLDVKMEYQEETSLFNTIYYKFQEYLLTHNVIDFDDMISLFVNDFDNYPEKTSILNQCKYILVEE